MTDHARHFSGTKAVAAAHQFDVGALSTWLCAQLGNTFQITAVEQFKGGQSNPTFKIITSEKTLVMRAKPAPAAKLLASAHAIEREYAVMKALAGTAVPVPKTLALCTDEAVIGRAFFIMEMIEGRIMWNAAMPDAEPGERTVVFNEMNRVIAALHQVDYVRIGLAEFGKPGNYFERQIGRWTKQYRAAETTPIEAMDNLIAWLPKHIPPGEETAIVHGDFRMDNLVFHPTEARILAVLDWELSTLGHPLADFAYHAMAWQVGPEGFRGVAGLDLAALGIPSLETYIADYCTRTGRDGIDNIDYYLAYNLFRMTGILQGVAKRAADGTAASEQAVAMGRAARPLAELVWRFAEKVMQKNT